MARGQSSFQANSLLFGSRHSQSLQRVDFKYVASLLQKDDFIEFLRELHAPLEELDHEDHQKAVRYLAKAVRKSLKPGDQILDFSEAALENILQTNSEMILFEPARHHISFKFTKLALTAFEVSLQKDLPVSKESLTAVASEQFIGFLNDHYGSQEIEKFNQEQKQNVYIGRSAEFAISKADPEDTAKLVTQKLFERGTLFANSTARKPPFETEAKDLLDALGLGLTYAKKIKKGHTDRHLYHVVRNERPACHADLLYLHRIKNGAWKSEPGMRCPDCEKFDEPEKELGSEWEALSQEENQKIFDKTSRAVLEAISNYQPEASKTLRTKSKNKITNTQKRALVEVIEDRIMQLDHKARWKCFGIQSEKPMSQELLQKILKEYNLMKNNGNIKNSYSSMRLQAKIEARRLGA